MEVDLIKREKQWLIRVIWDEENRQVARVLLCPCNGETAPVWTEFTDQDSFLRHLWHLIDQQAGVR